MVKEQDSEFVASSDENFQRVETTNLEIEEVLDELPSQGIVYILTREKQPGVCKVGYTGVSTKSRAKGYTDGDWIIYSEYSMPLWLARLTEKATHKQLEQYWLDPGITGGSAQEVFLCNPELADTALEIALAEEKESALKQLGVPAALARHITNDSELASIMTELEKTHRIEIASMDEKLSSLLDEKKALNDRIDQLEGLVESREQQISELERYFDSLTNSMSKDEFLLSLSELNAFNDRRHTYDDFTELLDHYRAAIRLIHSLELAIVGNKLIPPNAQST